MKTFNYLVKTCQKQSSVGLHLFYLNFAVSVEFAYHNIHDESDYCQAEGRENQ